MFLVRVRRRTLTFLVMAVSAYIYIYTMHPFRVCHAECVGLGSRAYEIVLDLLNTVFKSFNAKLALRLSKFKFIF